MSRFLHAVALVAFAVPFATAADTKSIDQAIDKGKGYLKARYARGVGDAGSYGIGSPALCGVAMLEARVPADDPGIKAITLAVREAAYTESKTYQVALCLVYLDRHEDPMDVPLIQVLALRLIAGQHGNAGWGYNTCGTVPADHVSYLKSLKAEPPPKEDAKGNKPAARLHPDVAKYAASIQKVTVMEPDDNSNTQFAILGLWLSRKHGAPVDATLDLIDKRFRGSQDPRTFGWGYSGPLDGGAALGAMTSPSMTCCGLLGLATGNARRVDSIAKPAVKKPAAKDDPFFTAPTKKDKEEKGPLIRDPAAMAALNALGASFAAYVQNGGVLGGGAIHGDRDLYFLWSIERVGVIYNVDKLGGVDWYDVGSDAIVKVQQQDGSWKGNYNAEVDTAFALLFLCKADLLRDLSNKFRDSKLNELRSAPAASGGTGNGGDPKPKDITPALPMAVVDPASKLANELVLAPETDWTKSLEKLRDAKGGDNTKGLVIAIQRLDGERKKEAREALAERLTRMSAETLKGMMAAEDSELRRGSVLAAAMKDDKTHVPDLIERLKDDDDAVVRAAKAGLKSLTSQDFGPKTGASKDECKAAAVAWKAWWDKQK